MKNVFGRLVCFLLGARLVHCMYKYFYRVKRDYLSPGGEDGFHEPIDKQSTKKNDSCQRFDGSTDREYANFSN